MLACDGERYTVVLVAWSKLFQMKIAILWTNWSGYMDACARALQSFTKCDLDIICSDVSTEAPFARSSFFQYPCNVGSREDISGIVTGAPYDLVLICGWHIAAYRFVARALAGKAVRVLCMDNQWAGSRRQWLGICVSRLYLLSLFDYAFVPGVRQSMFARRLGFPTKRIIEGHYSCDVSAFSAQSQRSLRPKSFLFVGRMVKEKGLELLAEAWGRFSDDGRHREWGLTLCGTGPLSETFSHLPQTELLGFVQPQNLPNIMTNACALVLPSLKEPWGLVIHEAAACGLPLIVSDSCGAADYFCRHGLNGYCVNTADADSLFDALLRFSELTADERQVMGRRSELLAGQRTPATWAANVTRALVSEKRVM
jgi:glycosyltransferase involved in cell wall biosynthesis